MLPGFNSNEGVEQQQLLVVHQRSSRLVSLHEHSSRYCINELMQGNTHVHGCLVAEEPAGVFHSRGAGA